MHPDFTAHNADKLLDRWPHGNVMRGWSRIAKSCFWSYGFSESHAASFANPVYASCWLKCHYPAALACARLNSQPMGFYGPSQIVQDVRRHYVFVRPVDVRFSDRVARWKPNCAA